MHSLFCALLKKCWERDFEQDNIIEEKSGGESFHCSFFCSIFILNEIILDFLLHLKFIRAILNLVSGTQTKRTQRKTNQMPV